MKTNLVQDQFYQALVEHTLKETRPTSFTRVKDIATKITLAMQERDPSFALTNLGMGHPAVQAPAQLLEAEARYGRELSPSYGDFEGSLELRKAGAKIFKTYFGLPDATEHNIYITAGAMAMNHIFWTYLAYHKMKGNDPKLLYFEPGYAEVPDQLEELGFELSDLIVPLSLSRYRGEELNELGKIIHPLQAARKGPIVAHWARLGNPIPFRFSPEEYAGLGRQLNEYDSIGFEDEAYPMDRDDWMEGKPILNIGQYATYALVNVSFSKLLGLGNRRCAMTYVSPALQERFTQERAALSKKTGIDEIRSRIRHTHTHAPLPIQLAVAEYLSQPNMGQHLQTGIRPYQEICERACADLQKKGYELALTNPDGSLAKVFYLPSRAKFEDILCAGILTTPLTMFSTTPETRMEGVRIAIPGIMPDWKTGSMERYEIFQERLEHLQRI